MGRGGEIQLQAGENLTLKAPNLFVKKHRNQRVFSPPFILILIKKVGYCN